MSHKPDLAILLLEDQGLVRAGMRALIQISEPEAQIFEADSYDAAVAMCQKMDFDIAFLDIDLKGVRNGLDFLQHLRETESTTRVIMLSGHAEKHVVMDCIDKGASGYILKDMENDGLFRKALDTVFADSIFLPTSIMGRGGFSPSSPVAKPIETPEDLGIKGRPLEALYWLCQGLPNKLIARKMGIEEETVRKDYNTFIFRKLGVSKRTEAIVEVARRGLIIKAPASVG